MKLILILMLAISSFGLTQNPDAVARVEFSSLTRGYQEFVIITHDSVMVTRTQAGQPKVAKKHALKKNDWQEILKALGKIKLTEIPELKSPSMKRAYDGARHSTITITTESKKIYSHSFDDENPHERLKAIMGVIIKRRGK